MLAALIAALWLKTLTSAGTAGYQMTTVVQLRYVDQGWKASGKLRQ